ncbi:hypothetical protein EVAR_12618_1 [Eumeta japonica]|uniref:Uncharacterized protein n=1 Tax=Eumeta variegata TaxID=151549 RepID=A0A4C1UES4_EUMVA|nr:hypothetical protein EVAR_12618_1 [Eumeta japonica]
MDIDNSRAKTANRRYLFKDNSTKMTAAAPKQATVGVKSNVASVIKPTPPPKGKKHSFALSKQTPTYENRSHARALQRKVKVRLKEIRNENWSDLMMKISPSHQAY